MACGAAAYSGPGDELGREAGAEALQGRGGAPERELENLRPSEVAVDRIVEVHADATVEVLRGVHHALGAVGAGVVAKIIE